MAKVYIDAGTDTVYVQRGKGDYIVIGQDSDPVTVFSLPGAASELANPDNTELYYEAYDNGYADAEAASYSSDDLDDEYQRGYDEGRADGYDEGYEAAQAEGDEAP